MSLLFWDVLSEKIKIMSFTHKQQEVIIKFIFFTEPVFLIGLVDRVFVNGPGDLGSIPGHKWYLILPGLILSNIMYVSRVKWSNPGKGVASSTLPRCSSYWKGSLLVALDYGRQFYFTTAVRVFANGPGDLGSIPGRVIPKTLKMELDTTLLNTQHYKVRFKGKVEQSREWSSALPYTLV